MNKASFFILLLTLGASGCGEHSPPETTYPVFNVDQTRITVSGLSAGAYMAGQYHLAHSSGVAGAGLIAGGPYRCANGSMSQALGPCMNGSDIGLAGLLDYAQTQADLGAIDTLDNLSGDNVWVFHGAKDEVIDPAVITSTVEFYSQVASNVSIESVTGVSAPHGMPTIVGNGACEEMVKPFLNNCGYDAAGALLKSVAAVSNARADKPDGELIALTQVGASGAEMLNEALLFVPAECASGQSCGLHIAFHGCQQSTEFVEDAYATGAGYNEWATNNQLLVLYPQVASSRLAPLNPLGCWDWWGYTGENYATRSGAQIAVVKALVDSLSGTTR